jgi:hypothetical protein
MSFPLSPRPAYTFSLPPHYRKSAESIRRFATPYSNALTQ